MKNKVYTFNLPVAIVNKLNEIYQEKNDSKNDSQKASTNISKAILDGIAYALADLPPRSPLDDFYLHQLLTIEDRRQTKQYSVRCDETLELILDHYKPDSLTNSKFVTFLLERV